MPGYFTDGNWQLRPGLYYNIDTPRGNSVVAARDGVVAVLFKSDFGPLNEVVEFTSDENYKTMFGEGGTIDTIDCAIQGGASDIVAVRVGKGGTAANVQLGEVCTINAKYPGSKAFSVTVKESLTDEDTKEITFYSGNTLLEKYTIDTGQTEGASLKAAMSGSKYFDVSVNTDGTIAATTQKEFTAGTDPTASAEDYSKAMETLEPYYFNALCADTNDNSVHLLMHTFLERVYENGTFAVGFVAENTGELETRMNHAAAFNDEKIAYILNPSVEGLTKVYDGYQTAAVVAGMYAAIPCNKALTHKAVPGISVIKTMLTPSQIVEGIKKGCISITYSPSKTVRLDNSNNTLVNPPENKDEGWKKLRRTKTRFELIYRMNTQVDEFVGEVDTDTNGKATIMAQLQMVADAMISENKITSCTISTVNNSSAGEDAALFNIDVIDKETAEHIYLYYVFRQETEVTE